MTVPGEGPYTAPQSPSDWSPTPPTPSDWSPTPRAPSGWPDGPWLDGPWYEPPLVHPSSRGALVVRVLVAVGLILGLAQTAARPVGRTTDDLFFALQEGRVDSITIERPTESLADLDFATVTLRVQWTGPGLRPYDADYTWTTGDPDGALDVDGEFDTFGPATDTGELILDAADEAGVPVTVTRVGTFGPSGTGGVVWFPGWPLWSIGAWLAALLLLIAGPQPRLATKWAWFWLGSLPPLWLAFVVLEPLPLWARRPELAARPRLTGGWAFLLSIVLVSVVAATWPDWSDVLANQSP